MSVKGDHTHRRDPAREDSARGRIARSEVHYPDTRRDTMNANTDRASFLRRSLQLDGIASGLCGVLLVAAASPISAAIGLAEPVIAQVVRALLVVYAAALLLFAVLEVVGLTRLRKMAG